MANWPEKGMGGCKVKVLVTGHQGYIGRVLVKHLLDSKHEVTGLDTNFFKEFNFLNTSHPVKEIIKDVRKVTLDDVRGFDAIIHLAALSNDASGELNPALTNEVNYLASVRLAKLAAEAGVERFLFSSSCSLYGDAGQSGIANENSPFNPLTAYAKSKVDTEQALSKISSKSFAPVYLRNSTVYGLSSRMRFDLVVNNLCAYAVTNNVVEMMSDGTPWRPILHLNDLSRAFLLALEADADEVRNQAFNVGADHDNYQIKALAEAVCQVSGAELKILNLTPDDNRSYRVSFSKIAEILKFKTSAMLKDEIKNIIDFCRQKQLTAQQFQDREFFTLKQIKHLLDTGQVDSNLYWNSKA